jgi:RND family efflux transporter MFP subunit
MADQLSSDLASLRISREENPELARNRRRILIGIVVALVAVLVLALVVAPRLGARVFKTEVDVTRILLVSPAQASIQVTSTGFVVAQRQSKVGAKVMGRVAEVLVTEGDAVKAGDVLVRLESAEQEAALAAARARASAARARVQSATASLAETQRQYEREKELAQQGASVRTIAEDLEVRVQGLQETANAARADAQAAEAELDQLELTLTYMTITAPIDGVVTTKPVGVGELVGPTTPDPVLEISDFTSLEVETDVPEARLGLVKVGGPAEIVLDAYPTLRHRGRVTEISPRVNRVKATVVVRVAFVDAAEGVLPDMAARVSFLEGELDAEAVKEPPKVVVPSSALVARGGDKFVFVLDENGTARQERVTLGAAMGPGFELVDGPPEGTKVIANPPAAIADGYPVKERIE